MSSTLTPLELAVRSAPRLTSTRRNYAVLSRGTIILYDEGGPLDDLEYECPGAHKLTGIDAIRSSHPDVYRVLATGGFPYRGVTPRGTSKVGDRLFIVEWAGGQVAHVINAYTESSAEAFASKAYVDDYLSPVVVETGRYIMDKNESDG